MLKRNGFARFFIYDIEIAENPMDIKLFPNTWGDAHRFPLSTYSYHVCSVKISDEDIHNMRIVGYYTGLGTQADLVEFKSEVKRSDIVMTYNGVGFDNVVMNKYMDGPELDQLIQFDLMICLKELTGTQFKLDEVGEAIKMAKNSDGAAGAAIDLWKESTRESAIKLCRYNIGDVNVLGVVLAMVINCGANDCITIPRYKIEKDWNGKILKKELSFTKEVKLSDIRMWILKKIYFGGDQMDLLS